MERSYRQYCAVAKALDVIGERWTLLIVRELLLGPRRYTDLLAGLPGIGTNLLAARLRKLEAAGLLNRRVLPPPAGSTAYELTALGRGLQTTLLDLGRWGAHLLADLDPADERRAGWYVVSMLATFKPDLAAGLDADYELRIDRDHFAVHVADGQVTLGPAPTARPTLVVSTDLDTLLALLAGSLTPTAALDDGRATIQGDQTTFEQFIRIFAWTQPPRTPSPDADTDRPHTHRASPP